MTPSKNYIGIDQDVNGGMTDIGKIIRDAWVFEIIPEGETCEGWSLAQIDQLYDQTTEAWAPYGHQVGAMPEDLRARFMRIQSIAVERAKRAGWRGAHEIDEDD